jgi:hypothetical protein
MRSNETRLDALDRVEQPDVRGHVDDVHLGVDSIIDTSSVPVSLRPGVRTASATRAIGTTETESPTIPAAFTSRAASPITTYRVDSAISGYASARTTTFGPMPAPSPMVTAM